MEKPSMDDPSRKQTKAEKIARAWLFVVSLTGAAIFCLAILGATPVWVGVLSGVIAAAALWGTTIAPPNIRMALAEFLAWPWF
jgi:hypothetical protein